MPKVAPVLEFKQRDRPVFPRTEQLKEWFFMSTGWRRKKISGALLLSAAVLCMGSLNFAQIAAQPQAAAPQLKSPLHTKKATKRSQPQLPPLPSGPTGPVQQVPLDSIAAVPPQVSFQNDQLTIVAPNSTLADILRAVRKQTGADIEVPSAPERVVTHLGPGPAREIVAELLNGSRFNYVLLGSPTDDALLTRVVLVAKSNSENLTANPAAPGNPQPNNAVQPGEQAIQAANEPEQNDDAANTDDAADQAAAEAEQQQQIQGQPSPDQPAIKTPQQMLQEMQQRQMQLQQQQVPGQPPVPGSGMPPHPPQEQ